MNSHKYFNGQYIGNIAYNEKGDIKLFRRVSSNYQILEDEAIGLGKTIWGLGLRNQDTALKLCSLQIGHIYNSYQRTN